MILFMHGLLSNPYINKKYKDIIYPNKICKTVQYQKQSYAAVSKFYDDLIDKHNPKLIVGHSMGGYWAITKSKEYDIPCMVMNPFFTPNTYSFIFKDYKNITHDMLDKKLMSFHLELGDKILNMYDIMDICNKNDIKCNHYHGGSHFIKYSDKMNILINEQLEHYYGISSSSISCNG